MFKEQIFQLITQSSKLKAKLYVINWIYTEPELVKSNRSLIQNYQQKDSKIVRYKINTTIE